MPFYSYKAIDRSGAMVRGSVEVDDIDAAQNRVLSSGLYLIKVRKLNRRLASLKRRLDAKKVKRGDIIEFAGNLSVMIKAGIPIISAHTALAESIENKYFRLTIENVRRTIELGSSFSDALAAHRDIFPDIFIRLVSIGEETGTLDQSLSDVATHLQRMEDFAAALKRALIYPVFALLSTFAALLFWFVYVLPKVMDIFKDLGIKLPLPTRMLLEMSDFSRRYWYLIVFTPVAAVLVVKLLGRKKKARYYLDLAQIKFPIIKHIIYNKLLALFSEQLRILTKAGVTIDRSFQIISGAIGNEVFVEAIDNARDQIAKGSRISDAIRHSAVFPPLIIRMIDVGESTGSLDEQFANVSQYYVKKLDDISLKIGKMLEPVVISVIGCIFAFIILGLLLPIYDLVSKMR